MSNNFGTPLPQDLFSRLNGGMYDETELIGVPTAGLSFFGAAESNSRTLYSPDSNTVDIEIIRGDERIAALVPRGQLSRDLGSLLKNGRAERWSAFSRKYPLAVETSDITAEDLTVRGPGEPAVNSGVTQMQRLRRKAAKLHMENIRRILRLCEVLSWQSLMTGTQDGILGTANADLKYDFRRNAAHAVQCPVSWAGGAADIMGDIDGGCAKLRANGHITPDMLVMGSGSNKSFATDAKIRALADNRRMGYISLANGAVMPGKFQRFVDGGMVFQGNLKTFDGYELALFTYPEVYTAANGTATKYIADDKCLLTSSAVRCDRYFGPSEGLPMIPMRAQLYRELFGIDPTSPPVPMKIKGGMAQAVPAAAFFCSAHTNEQWTRVSIKTDLAPIFVTTQTDGFVVLDTEP